MKILQLNRTSLKTSSTWTSTRHQQVPAPQGSGFGNEPIFDVIDEAEVASDARIAELESDSDQRRQRH